MDKEDVIYMCVYTYTHTHTHTYTHTHTHTHTIAKYYLAIKKNEILPFATLWMELEGMMLTK